MSKIDKLNIEIDEKIFKKILITGIVVVICYLAITFLSFSIPRIYKIDKNTVIDEGTVKTGITNLYRGSIRLEISGWAYKNEQSIESFESYFVLKNKKSEKMYILNTAMEQVPELQYIDNTYYCLNCGLHSHSIILGLQNGNYDLYILYKNNQENLLVNTGVIVNI